ncbi:hypothetical protein [Streptomyces sp. OR43]|uniref:hypothetical protein n=1 Tax=Streptomyces sp. or43 TaxID=2478957 RepID=UPI0011CDCBE8|nr:hypothetical protein [Streptomyces sp. or43]TXS36922.1 hypothetical protein EAO72_26405 [Streptomyces sp. or43]
MASQRLTFVLDGRDGLTPVMRRAGESSEDFRRRLQRVTGGASSDLQAFTRDADGRLRDLRGRFLTTSDAARLNGLTITGARRSTADWSAVADRASGVGEKLAASLMSLAPAAIPAAASLAPLAAGAGAVAVAALAFTGALVPQISALSKAGEAQQKYEDAVSKSGRTSEAAITAQLAYQRVMADLPPETREAAVALGLLKDASKEWSDSLAGDTMPAFTKGLALANNLLPKTKGLVKGTGAELDRMMTVLGGAMESPGFDRLNSRFTTFANGTLRKVDNQLIHLMRTMDTGEVGGNLGEFMDYARAQGPVVADTLGNVGEALGNILVGASGVGVSMLDIVNGLSGIASAVPSEAISTILQLVVAIKLAKLAAAGMAAGRAAMAAFTAEIVAMRAAAAAAPSRLAGVTAGIGAMSRGARLAAAGAGIGLLVIGLMELQKMGQKAPPDIDKMSASLGRFAENGQVAGEAARVFGKDLNGLMASLSVMGAKDADEFFERFDKNPVGFKEAKKNVEALDKSLASLVAGGKADLAAAALDRIKGQMGEAGFATSGLRNKLTEYKEALADKAFEEQLAAQSLGLFGAQSQQVQQKLDAQKASADGLRQSISALNESHRQGLGGMIGFEAAIDAAAKAARDNAGALDMSGGKLNLNSEKARNAATALNDLAAKTDEAAAQARESGASWSTVNGIYDQGREKLLASADVMGLNTTQARQLADQILKTPDKTARLRGNLEDLAAKLADAKRRLAAAPSSKTARIRGEISDLKAKIAQAKYDLSSLRNKTVSVMIQYRTQNSGASDFAKSIGGYASGGKPRPGELAWVGEQGPELMRFGGGGTEIYSHGDSMAMVSDAAKAGRDAGMGLRQGMAVSTGEVEAGGHAIGAAVVRGIEDELEIASPSKRTTKSGQQAGKGVAKGLKKTKAEVAAEAKRIAALAAAAGTDLIKGLTGSTSQITSTVKSLTAKIWAAWQGKKSTKDSALVKLLNADNVKLQKLAKQRDALASKIAAAKKYAGDLTASARQGASLGQLGLDDEQVTASSIKAGLTAKLAKIKTFTNYIGILAKRGLSKSLIRQILDMGPEAGYAYASALAGASSTTLKSINATQSSIDKATTTLGRNGADLLYDSGKNAGKGFLAGLESQQDAIEAQMLKIAKGMQKAIRKALGIKSPSRVMAVPGRQSTEGLAVGMVEGLPAIDRAIAAVTGRIAGTRPVLGRPAVHGAGGGSSITVNVDARGAMDPVAVGREVERIMVRFGRSQGLAVAVNR